MKGRPPGRQSLRGQGLTDQDAERVARLLAIADEPLPEVRAALSQRDLGALAATGRLRGEAGRGWAVYRITFADRAAYVGITSWPVLDRVERHLGLDLEAWEGRPAAERAEAGVGTWAIVRRVAAGVRFRIRCVASGLAEGQARDLERVLIGRLRRPLNGQGARRSWRDPLDPDPGEGPVARLHYGAGRSRRPR